MSGRYPRQSATSPPTSSPRSTMVVSPAGPRRLACSVSQTQPDAVSMASPVPNPAATGAQGRCRTHAADPQPTKPPQPAPPKVHKRKPLSETKVGARVLQRRRPSPSYPRGLRPMTSSNLVGYCTGNRTIVGPLSNTPAPRRRLIDLQRSRSAESKRGFYGRRFTKRSRALLSNDALTQFCRCIIAIG